MKLALRAFFLSIPLFRQFLIGALLCISFSVLCQNQAPIVNDGVFRVSENATIEDIIARVDARDPDIGDVLTYSITAGNDNGFLFVDNEGLVRLTQSGFLYRRNTNSFTITVEATDQDGLSDNGEITLQIIEAKNDLEADLEIYMVMLNNEAETDEETDFIIVLENYGPDHMDFAEVEIKIPNIPDSDKDYEILSHTLTKGTYSSDDERWNLSDILPGDIDSLVVRVRIVDDGHEGHNHMLATVKIVNSGEADDNEDENNESEAGLGHGENQADLQITKTISNETANPGEFVNFRILAENLGPSRARKVEVIDELPSGYSYVFDLPSTGNYNSNNGVWNVGNLDPGDSEFLLITALVLPSGEYLNTAIIEDTQGGKDETIDVIPGNNESSAGIIEIQEADISVSKSVDNSTPSIGDIITFTISASNNGPNDATNITIEERLQSGYTYISHTTSDGTYNTVTGHWEFDALANGVTKTMTLTVSVNSTGEYRNTAELFDLDQVDPDDSNDYDELVLDPPKADLEIRKSYTPEFPNINEPIFFTLNLTNLGPSADSNIIVEDILDGLFTYVGSSPSQGTYNPVDGLWAVGSLANGGTAQLVIEAKILPLPTPTETNVLRNIASIQSSDAFDPNTDNNSSEVIIDLPTSDIALSKTVNESFPNVSDEIIFTVTALNNGPTKATNLILEDRIPLRFNYVRHEATLGTYDPVSGQWNIGDLNRNGQAKIDFFVTVNAEGDSVNRAKVINLDQFDPIAENDTARERVETKIIDLAIDKTVSNSNPNIGEEIVFSLELSLASAENTSSANNIIVEDMLPSGYNYINYTSNVGTYDPLTGEWSIPNLDQNIVGRLDLLVSVNSPGASDYLNIATITASDEFDENVDNDEATASISIASLDIEVVKSVDNPTPNIGNSVTFSINVTNLGESDATGLSILDLLTDGFLYVSATPSAGNYNETSGIWTIGNLAKDQSAKLDVAA